MALVTMKRLFDHAMKEKYTVGAYNVFNLRSCRRRRRRIRR